MTMNSLTTNPEFLNSISNHIAEEMKNQIPNADKNTKDMLMRTAKQLAQDNSDLVVNYVQKCAAERAVKIITTRLRDGLLIRSAYSGSVLEFSFENLHFRNSNSTSRSC